jgi:hypothetical protein
MERTDGDTYVPLTHESWRPYSALAEAMRAA